MAVVTPPAPQLDRDFDVCCRCACIMYEGEPLYLLTICKECWKEMVNRQQQPSSCCVHQHQQQATCGHHFCHSNGHEFRDRPVRCSSPTLDYSHGKISKSMEGFEVCGGEGVDVENYNLR